ncbi:unnamed protein product [Rhizoctonia solani]|uniref:C2H2-type domain-containing protein n=3 Tax=Rhizoctonia solani TaxID=456999 RepID=A0A8H3DS83_9AGAM|nr:C2H2-type zinc-finger protein [Rhizoctonia solani AG-3 Rhs1AP]KEP52203.1 C2H2-type zinc-finger protein [Rhizoctonia solani 123E]CAE6444563.1 unnamed protein product [Rhizoctonia solani]CAE6533860.1 unnamed protein product [Rhizoctonia solani]
MESWLFFLILTAEALLIMSVLDCGIELELPLALSHILKKINHNLVWFPNTLGGITTRKLFRTNTKHSGKNLNDKVLSNQSKQTEALSDNGRSTLIKDLKSSQISGIPIQGSPRLNSSRHCFPRAPVSKGHTYTCPTHNGSVVGCATFFEHENHEYKLLCRGELYFRPKGTHTFRTGPIVPKEPGRLFVVKLDGTGSNVVAFCFEPSSRALGEVNGHAEFLPVQTSIASSQEAHGLVYAQGQGCVFDWVYGDRSSSQYPWDYSRRYDVGWMHSSPATEELFDPNDELLAECCPPLANSQNPLKHSLEGFDLVENMPSPDPLGDIQVGLAQIEFNHTGAQHTHHAQPPASSSAQPSLPYPLASAPQSGASTLNSSVLSKSVLRRTCNICNRVLRRPSALTIHMNAHYGVKPFQCSDCDYSSTNVTNLQRHQQTKHAGSSSGGK